MTLRMNTGLINESTRLGTQDLEVQCTPQSQHFPPKSLISQRMTESTFGER